MYFRLFSFGWIKLLKLNLSPNSGGHRGDKKCENKGNLKITKSKKVLILLHFRHKKTTPKGGFVPQTGIEPVLALRQTGF